MQDDTSLLQFPCDFPLKIIGLSRDDLIPEIVDIIRKHYPDTPDVAIRHQPSSGARYVSITATIMADSRESLDALYRDLTRHPDIKMVL